MKIKEFKQYTLPELMAMDSGIQQVGDAGILTKGTLQSDLFKTGVSGWELKDNGDAEFNNVIVRGSITAGDGSTINGTYLVDGTVTNAKIDSLSVNKLTAGTITSKAITLAVSEGTGDSYIAAGKTDFTTTGAGFILGIDDSDSNIAKFYLGDDTNYLYWDGSSFTSNGVANVNSLNIPDTTTANSMHVETDGDTYWGCNVADFTSSHDNANAYILKDGSAKFQKVTIDAGQVINAVDVVGSINPTVNYTTGEYIGEQETVMVAVSGISDRAVISQLETGSPVAMGNSMNRKLKQTFQAPSTQTVFYLNLRMGKTGSPTDNVVINLYDDTDTLLDTKSVDGASLSAGYSDAIKFTFSSPITFTASTEYYIELTRSGSPDNSHYYLIDGEDSSALGYDPYTDGKVQYWNGSSWVNVQNEVIDFADIYFGFYLTYTAGNAYRASALTTDYSDTFLGFSLYNTNYDADAIIQYDGVFKNYTNTSITNGSFYYLSDTFGEIDSSAGSVTKKIGRGFPSDDLQIKYTI